MKAILTRLVQNEVQTHAKWHFYEGYEERFSCFILELPDRQNRRNISRIAAGKKRVKKRYSKKFGWHFHITEVEGRTWILVHAGNTYRHTRGCQLPGTSFKDIDNDGNVDVIWSRHTLDRMLDIAPEEFDLYIFDADD